EAHEVHVPDERELLVEVRNPAGELRPRQRPGLVDLMLEDAHRVDELPHVPDVANSLPLPASARSHLNQPPTGGGRKETTEWISRYTASRSRSGGLRSSSRPGSSQSRRAARSSSRLATHTSSPPPPRATTAMWTSFL